MSDIVLLIIFTIILFLAFFIVKHFWGSDALFVVGIGSIIAANTYNISAFPIEFNGIIFGFDSVIYTLFAFSGLLMYIEYGKERFKAFLYCSIGSVLLTSFFAFCGYYSLNGISQDLVWSSLSHLNSAVATLVAMWVMVWLYQFLCEKKGWKPVLGVLLGLVVVSIINTLIYFTLTFLFQGDIWSVFVNTLLGSWIGKLTAIILCILIFAIKMPKKS